MSEAEDMFVIGSYFYISIYSGSSVRNLVAISLQNIYRTQSSQVRARNEFVKNMYDYIHQLPFI